MSLPIWAGMAAVLATGPALAADWQAKEQVKTYAISGAIGPELYASIGENGPLIGQTRAIALTNWDLKWRRDYQREGTACALKSALPFLIITTTLPKPKARLSGSVAAHWKTFIDGITAHERVHGQDIIAMTEEIITGTVGLRVKNDPGCTLIRAEVLSKVKAANEAYKEKARAFDTVEMSKDGNVQRLILSFVNGG